MKPGSQSCSFQYHHHSTGMEHCCEKKQKLMEQDKSLPTILQLKTHEKNSIFIRNYIVDDSSENVIEPKSIEKLLKSIEK